MGDKEIENLYKVFSRYPLREKIVGCPHCELKEAESRLHTTSLREITWEDFGVYPFKAMTTFGDVEDFKHFLPRLLELYKKDYDGSRYSIGILLTKLNYGEWHNWQADEKNAISGFLESWINSLNIPGKISRDDETFFKDIEVYLEEYHRKHDSTVSPRSRYSKSSSVTKKEVDSDYYKDIGSGILVDNDGYLLEPSQWCREYVEFIAKTEKCSLTQDHWEIINFMREHYVQNHMAPTVKQVSKMLGKKLNQKKDIHEYLEKLFPRGVISHPGKYAGFPRTDLY